MKKRNLFIIILSLVFLLSFSTVSEAKVKPKLNKTKLTLTVGKSYKLKVKNGKAKKFSTSSKKIATVSKKGTIKAKKKGSCKIKVTIKGSKKALYCRVTVKAKKKANTSTESNTKDKVTTEKRTTEKRTTEKKTTEEKTTEKTTEATTEEKNPTVETPTVDDCSNGCSYKKELYKEATCNCYGYYQYVCTKCGDSYIDWENYIPRVDCNYVVDRVVGVTCTTDGYTFVKCTMCKWGKKIDIVKATGHSFGETVIVKSEGCTKETRTQTCTKCGEEQSQVYIDDTPSHDYKHKVVDEVTGAIAANVFVPDEHVDATCCSDGYDKYICRDCGYEKVEVIDKSKGKHTDLTMYRWLDGGGRPSELEMYCSHFGAINEVISLSAEEYEQKTNHYYYSSRPFYMVCHDCGKEFSSQTEYPFSVAVARSNEILEWKDLKPLLGL